jgi:hypothetical protein
MRDLRCEGCGDRFRCRVDDDQACWCETVEVTPAGRVALDAMATDCVCPACLAEASLPVVDLTTSSDVDA